ncbi:cupin domain-containing protein [Gluconacetobacter takamatsuzukensis]|uniref:Cupin domain-containing protein n=1 Tax=Gluconacetobacter takamatsuzukensis TaxID=1286190 RepID=A0A7W4PT01_9PROT|nr:cupin domain-containing protein [Gluconacetobacter takamatsuzukensis]MBB2205451.1 cupin domain-containing protein [Gluconacetobacter takamatsuzukensis]
MSRRTLLALSIAAGLAGVAPAARADDAAVIYTPAEIHWVAAPADFPKGVEIAYVYGKVDRPGPFVIRVRMPAHAQIAPHTHNMDETLTVLSGHFTHFVGDSFADAQKNELGAGGFVHLPKDTPHALRTANGPVVMEISGVGPFGMTYVNPADDPSKAR